MQGDLFTEPCGRYYSLPPMRAVTCQCDLPKGHDGTEHRGVDRNGKVHEWTDRAPPPKPKKLPPDDLRALTLTQPWCGLMASGIKLLENRPRMVIKNEDVLKQPDLVLHASREVDELVYDQIYHCGVRHDDDTPWYKLSRLTSAFLAVVKLRGALYIGGTRRDVVERSLEEMGLADQACFAFGPTIYIFSDVRPFAVPIPSKGKLGWWRLNDEQRAAVRAQVPR